MKHLEEARLLILNNKADASQDDMLLYLISLSEKRLVFLLNEHLRVRSLRLATKFRLILNGLCLKWSLVVLSVSVAKA